MKYIPASFAITPEQMEWIEEKSIEKARGTEYPISKSVVVREAIELMRKTESYRLARKKEKEEESQLPLPQSTI